MSETRPSMLRSCRVWLESRRDIPGDKLACMTALIGRAAERESAGMPGALPAAGRYPWHQNSACTAVSV